MKKLFLLALTLVFLAACNSDKKKDEPAVETEESTVEVTEPTMAYKSFGEEITDKDVITRDELINMYKNLQPGDSIAVKFTSEVKEVCQNKGCWMKMDMGEEEAMVRFKDYGFFMPKDIAGQQVIVEGYAFISEMSVEDQKHYAEDAGESPEEIAKITEPKRTLSFTSSGVLIPEEEPVAEKQ